MIGVVLASVASDSTGPVVAPATLSSVLAWPVFNITAPSVPGGASSSSASA